MIDRAAESSSGRAVWLEALMRQAEAPSQGRFWSWLDATLDPAGASPRQAPNVELRGFASPRLGASYVLKNDAAGTYLRLTPEEHFIWEHLDGRTVRQLLADYLAEFGRFATGRVFELLARLREASMLSEPPRKLYDSLTAQLTPSSWGRRAERVLKGVLFYERPLPGVNQVTRFAHRAGGWLLFTRVAPFVLATIALVGLAAFFGGLSQGEVLTTRGSFALGFLVFALANTLATLVAEAGRALATVHHGREVRAGGLRMMLATPTFYADTRDIWMEDRRARIGVAAAGPVALLVAAGAAGLLLRGGPPEPLADFLFKFALLCYGTTMFYLNPLVDLDGYTLLAEWLEQPDLRERSLHFVRGRLLSKLRARETLEWQERGLALFGVLAVLFAVYTAAGGVYFIGWRTVAGLAELWAHENQVVQVASVLATILLGAGITLLMALALLRALKEGYRWAERRGLLTEAGPLVAMAVGTALLLGAGALVAPGPPGVYRGLVAPPILLIVLIYALRLARHYQGALLHWFFVALAGYAGLIFVGEELSALQVFVQLDATWATTLERAISLIGLVIWLPFSLWLASLLTSRYRGPISLLAAGIALYALHGFVPNERLASALAATACALLAGGVLIYNVLRLRQAPTSTWQVGPALDDAGRLADAMAVLLAQLLDDVVAQSGRRAAADLERRFNQTSSQADWGLELRSLRLTRLRSRDLLTAAPIYRQALGFTLDLAAGRCGRPYVERALGRARDALPWDRREVLDAWVLAELPWARTTLGQAEAQRTELVRFLRRVPLFTGLDDAELAPIASAARIQRFPAGRRVINQGEPGDTFYLIRSGAVEVIKHDRSAAEGGRRKREQVVARLGEGDLFGELALLYDQPRNATVRAVTPVELLAIGRADFDQLVRERFSLMSKLGGALERERLLGPIPLFAELSRPELGALARRLQEIDLPPGEAVVRQGESGDSFYLVRSGRLVVTIAGETGEQHEVATLGPGEYFGEMALLHDQPRTATVTTVELTCLFVLRQADFDNLLRSNASAGRDLELVASRRRLDQEMKVRAQ